MNNNFTEWDEVYASDESIKEALSSKRKAIYLTTIPWSADRKFVCVYDPYSSYDYKKGNTFLTSNRRFIVKVDNKRNLIKAIEESKTELAVASLKISKAKSSVGYGGILGYKLPENETTIVEIPKSNEFSSLEEKFAFPVGVALETFGDKLLNKAAKVLESTLNQANCQATKIAVASSNDNSILFNVLSKSGKAFVVPVKVANKNVLSPEIALVNGSIRKIDNNLETSLHVNDLDKKTFASVSNLSLMNSEQLISFAKTLVASKELDKLELVLEAIKEKDINLYKNAYKFILADNLTKQASEIEKKKCAKLVNSPNSIYKVCSHTGLPENKTYVDELGQCRPLHSKDIVPEKGFFSTARILG